jgi:hypothetical protein
MMMVVTMIRLWIIGRDIDHLDVDNNNNDDDDDDLH